MPPRQHQKPCAVDGYFVALPRNVFVSVDFSKVRLPVPRPAYAYGLWLNVAVDRCVVSRGDNSFVTKTFGFGMISLIHSQNPTAVPL